MNEPNRTENLVTHELSLDQLNSVAGGISTTTPTPPKPKTPPQRPFEIDQYTFDIE